MLVLSEETPQVLELITAVLSNILVNASGKDQTLIISQLWEQYIEENNIENSILKLNQWFNGTIGEKILMSIKSQFCATELILRIQCYFISLISQDSNKITYINDEILQNVINYLYQFIKLNIIQLNHSSNDETVNETKSKTSMITKKLLTEMVSLVNNCF